MFAKFVQTHVLDLANTSAKRTAIVLAVLAFVELTLGVLSIYDHDPVLAFVALLAGLTQGMLAGAVITFDEDSGSRLDPGKKQKVLVSITALAGMCALTVGFGGPFIYGMTRNAENALDLLRGRLLGTSFVIALWWATAASIGFGALIATFSGQKKIERRFPESTVDSIDLLEEYQKL